MSQSFKQNPQNFRVHFLANLSFEEIQSVATTCRFVEGHATFCTSNIQGKELFMKYTSNIIMCQDTCEPICFKLGMMLNTTELYSWIPV